MSHEPTDDELIAAEMRYFHGEGTTIKDALIAANSWRDRRIRNEALEEAARLLARQMETYRQTAANYNPSASNCATLHDLAIACLEAIEIAYAGIRALKDKEPGNDAE